jgi:hypothetical protein
MPARPAWNVLIPAVLTGLSAATALADPVTLDGITFSDEQGGFRIVGGSGTGTLDDPFTITEDITDPEGAVLVVRGLDAVFGNRVPSHHQTGFALRKVVVNRTGETWTGFDLELREILDAPSDHGDGLSFGQATAVGHPFRSNRLPQLRETRDPFDALSFDGGDVPPDITVVFDLIVTDMTPEPVFYLMQRRDRPVADGNLDDNRPRVLHLTSGITGDLTSVGAPVP